ncbi:MAG: hypothetical protein K6E13_08960 [Lachnospiraceae bacterium]|nr:hypothetical protein [Lachnospiraceae bacterium]
MQVHDLFEDYFQKNKSAFAKCDDGYEVVDVKTSPNMIAHRAMQYSDLMEVLDEELRDKTREMTEDMEERYV